MRVELLEEKERKRLCSYCLFFLLLTDFGACVASLIFALLASSQFNYSRDKSVSLKGACWLDDAYASTSPIMLPCTFVSRRSIPLW